MKNSGVSVIICCYNAAGRIAPTLEALQRQRFRIGDRSIPWEVILVDNASSDNTGTVARSIWDQNPITDLRVVSESTPGLMFARKKGLATARYDIVSFVDDDNWVEEEWVQKVFDVFLNPTIGACGGRTQAVFEGQEPDWFGRFGSGFAVGQQLPETGLVPASRGYLWGAGLCFRKSLWEELQKRGFEPQTVGRQGKNISAGEDSELCYAFRLLGFQLYYRDDLLLQHYMPKGRMNFSYLLRMTRGFGQSAARLNLYRSLLEPDFAFHPWWYEWMAAWKNIVKLTARGWLISSPVLRQEWQIRKAYSQGFAAQIWADRNTLQSRLEKIKNTFSNP